VADNLTITKNVTKQSSNHSLTNNAIVVYITNVGTMSESSAYQYLSILNNFKEFITSKYDNRLSIDGLIVKIKNGDQDAYNLLNDYAAYLRNNNISALTLKQRIVTVKNFFEYCDIDISPRRFKLKVKLPRVVRKKKEAISKEDIIDILNIYDNIRLRTYVMLLAATGMRAT
jgi:integrase